MGTTPKPTPMFHRSALLSVVSVLRPVVCRSLLLQTGITSAQHALLLLESVIQKKGKVPTIERVVAEMLQHIGPATKEASSVVKVAAGHSCASVVAMLLDWSHCDKESLDLQVSPSSLWYM